MTKHRFIAYLLLAALSLSGCLSDSNEIRDAEVSLAITNPVSTSEMDTTDPEVNLAGVASSDMGIFRISWSNDRGGKGIGAGTDSWQTGSIGLELGKNRITVTAEDTTGATTSQSVTVNRESGEKGSTSLSWTPPASRVDGSPLNNLAGYKIDYGRMSGVYDYQIDVNNPGVLTYVVDDLVPGEWYFAVAAYDADGLESDRSNEASQRVN